MAQVIRSTSNLTTTLNRHKKITFADIKRLAQSAPGINVKWQKIVALPKQVGDCADRYAVPLERAISSFTSRLKKLIDNKISVATNSLHPALKEKLKIAKTDISRLQTSYSQFEGSVTAASAAFGQFSVSQRQAIGSLVPTPQNNSVQKAQDTLNKLNVVKTKLTTVSRLWEKFSAAQIKLARDIGSLKSALIAQGDELARDANRLAYIVFNGNLVGSQISQTNGLVNQWGVSIQTLPSRLAALATGGLSTQLEAQINQGISWMNSKKSTLLSCVTNATSNRSSILASSHKTVAINKTIQGLNAEAVGVVTSLKTLIPPRLDLLNQINSILNNAKNLSIRIANIGTTASDNFSTQISRFRSQLVQAKSCVVTNHNSIENKKAQLLNLLK